MTANGARTAYVVEEHPINEPRPLRIVVAGAGASGLNFAYAAKKYLRNVEFVIYEKNEAIGGVWFENRYPGVRCDIPAHSYTFSWNPKPDWTEFYVTGGEILQYFQETAKTHDLEKYVRLSHKVIGATWVEERGAWVARIENLATGEVFEDEATFFINASGLLNDWKWPDIPGLQSFKGGLLHSADWKTDVDTKGKTVGIIGNGASGIQLLPELQPEAAKITAFIRNPTWIVPTFAGSHSDGANFQYTQEQKKGFKENLEDYLQYRKELERAVSGRFELSLKDSDIQKNARSTLTDLMRQRLGPENPLCDRLIPDYAVMCRRATPGIGYLECFKKPNVRAVHDSIEEIVPDGIRTKTGEVVTLDVLVCATGFDVSFKPRFPVIGRNNINLAEQLKGRPVGYLGLALPNMPNYFVYFGPNSPLSHGSVLPSFEGVTAYLIRMIHKLQVQGYHSCEPAQQAVTDFVEHCDAFFPRTVWSDNCKSWFKGAEQGSPIYALHPGSRTHWVNMINEPRYEDFVWKTNNRNRFAYLGNGRSNTEVESGDITWWLADPERSYSSILY